MTEADGAAVRITGLATRYGPVRAVDGLDLTIDPGEVVALLGRNGAGESTTIGAPLGLTGPDAGCRGDGGVAAGGGRRGRRAVPT